MYHHYGEVAEYCIADQGLVIYRVPQKFVLPKKKTPQTKSRPCITSIQNLVCFGCLPFISLRALSFIRHRKFTFTVNLKPLTKTCAKGKQIPALHMKWQPYENLKS